MQKEIKYSGYTAQPDDYSCADGDLSLALGCIPDNGAMQPVFKPKEVYKLATGEDIIFIHKTGGSAKHTVYIVYNQSSGLLKGIDADATTTSYAIGTVKSLYEVNAIGNTLIALSPSGLHYWLWKKGAYTDLGDHIPELPISFGLKYEWKQGDEFKIEYGGHSLMYDSSKYGFAFCNTYDVNSTVGGTPNDDYITQRVQAKANKFIADEATNKGRFIYPFLVRYAFRLFDGNYAMASAPILMECVTGCSPLPLVTRRSYNGNGDAHRYYECWWCRITAPVFDLMYKVISSSALTELKKWEDIVKSVDIFISKPVYTYDQNGKIESNVPTSTIDFSVYGSNSGDSQGYTVQSAITRIKKYITDNDYASESNVGFLTPLPARTADSIYGDIENTGNFFLLKSYRLDELVTTMSKVDVKSDYLQSLVNRTQLPSDDFDSHDTLLPTRSFAYNQRLNLSGISKSLFEGFKPDCLHSYMDKGYNIDSIFVFIKQDGEEIIVSTRAINTSSPSAGEIRYFFYPNANAYKAIVSYRKGGRATYNLKEHPFLNGAYYFDGFKTPTSSSSTTAPTATSAVVSQPSKVYTSAVNNPFFFPLNGINTVGTGTIMDICAAARPLSQGQFGQFPLYCFSSDGIWALEVSDTGTYKAKQPISRDVCVNADSITQMDSSVLFVTDRGIMHISGSVTECLSDIIDTETPFSISALGTEAQVKALINVFNSKLSEDEQQTTDQLPSTFTIAPFRTFLIGDGNDNKGCRMVYDYTHQHVIVFNPSYQYAYVYSLRSRAWGMLLTLHALQHPVNAYPSAMAVEKYDEVNRLVDFSAYGDTSQAFLIITRPLKLDNPDVHKTVDTIIQRGMFHKGNVCQVLYASRDLYNWQLIWSSTDHYLRGNFGTPYKYFRLAVIGSLSDGETLYGCSVSYTPRLTDQLR